MIGSNHNLRNSMIQKQLSLRGMYMVCFADLLFLDLEMLKSTKSTKHSLQSEVILIVSGEYQ